VANPYELPNHYQMDIETGIAIWGGVAGTLALGLQFWQYRKDRHKLVVKASMIRVEDGFGAAPRLKLRVEIANLGSRSISVEDIAVRLRSPADSEVGRKGELSHALNLPSATVKVHPGEKEIFEEFPYSPTFASQLPKKPRVTIRDIAGRDYHAYFTIDSSVEYA